MDKFLISKHRLLSDHSTKEKIRTIIIGWIIFLSIYIVTRIPTVQGPMVAFADKMRVGWITSSVNFTINGLWIFFIVLGVGTIYTLLKKQTFDEIWVYNVGLGFYDSKSGEEKYQNYNNIHLSYGMMQESVWIESKAAAVKRTDYGWKEFDNSDVLRNNLERYGDWRAIK